MPRALGKISSTLLGERGARVVICDIDEVSGLSTASELKQQGISAEMISVDLSQRGAAQNMIEQVIKRSGRIDVLVNNARSGRRTSFFEEDEDSWEATISVTLKAAFFASQVAIKEMAKTGGGNVVNISSVVGLLTSMESPVYHIAKAGMIHMTRYLAAQGGNHKVRVNSVLPGFVVKDEHKEYYQSEGNEQFREIAEFSHPVGRIGNSDDVANAVLFLCGPDSSFITGQSLVVDGGLSIQEQRALLDSFDRNSRSPDK